MELLASSKQDSRELTDCDDMSSEEYPKSNNVSVVWLLTDNPGSDHRPERGREGQRNVEG